MDLATLLRSYLAEPAMPQRLPQPGDPDLPPQGMTIATSQNPPQADAIAGALGLPPNLATVLGLLQQTGEMGPRAVQAAGQAADTAYQDPSVGNIARATGRAAMVPAMASPIGRAPLVAGAGMGVQMADAALRDMGVGDISAEAQTRHQRAMERERLRLEEARKAKTDEIEATSKARREEEQATREGEIAAEAARKDRDIYDAKIKTARERRAVELARQKQFADTELGKTFTEWGSAAPWLAGGLAGGATRIATPGYSLVKPLIAGAAAGAGTGNWPLISDAAITPPVLNPEREGAEKYAIEAPQNDPDRPRMEELARTLPRANPIRTQAREELFGPYGSSLIGRSAITGAEGALASEIAYNVLHGLGRGASGLARFLGGGHPGGPPSGSPTPGSGGAGIQPLIPAPAPTAIAPPGSSAGIPPPLPGGGGLPGILRGGLPPQLPPPQPAAAPQPNPLPSSVIPGNTNVAGAPEKVTAKTGQVLYQDPDTKRFVSPPPKKK